MREEQEKKFSWIICLLIIMGGAQPSGLAKCPPRDLHNVLTIACLLLIVWVWQTALFTMVGHMMLAERGEFRVGIALGGVLIATIVLLLDSYVIVRSSWALQGLEDLRRGGLDIPQSLGAKIKNGVFVLLRIGGLSTPLAVLTALFFSILLFDKDVNANLEQEFQKHNQPLLARISGQVDGAIAEKKAEHEEVRKETARLNEEEKTLRATLLDPLSDVSEFKAVLDRVNKLTEAKAEAQKELVSAEKVAADELGGTRSAGTSGIPGYGVRRRAADEKIASARGKLENVTSDLEATQKQVDFLREAMKEAAAGKRSIAEGKLQDLAIQRKEKHDRLTALEAELLKRERDRDATVARTLETDPAFRKKEDGFLARLEGLHRIMERPVVWFVVLILHIGLFGLELAAVLAKIATFIPTRYAADQAGEDYFTHVEIARSVHERVAGNSGGSDEEPPAGAPAAPPPPPPAPADTANKAPKEVEDIVEAVRAVFPENPTGGNEVIPPHRDTAIRRRKGRPNGKVWSPQLTHGHEPPPVDQGT